MADVQIDYAAVFRDLPIPVLLLTPDFVVADVNPAYLEITGRTREELLGRVLFEAFPDNPANPDSSGVRDITASFRRVLATRKPGAISLQRYDVEVPGHPGLFATRYWSAVNAPVFGRNGEIVLIVGYVEEMTERVRKFIGGLGPAEPSDEP
jgi:PAS domain S-box-containing protein